MARLPNNFGLFGRQQAFPASSDASYGVSVGQFFNAVYAWMTVGLALTGLVAMLVHNYSLSHPGFLTPGLVIVLFIASIGLVMAISGAINSISAGTATVLFLLYSAITGVWMSALFAVYAKSTIALCFFETAGLFGVMSIWGYTTRRSLITLGSYLYMALIGLVIASVVSMFWANSVLDWIISYAGVIVFVGLTAVDTQRLKYIAMEAGNNSALAHRLAIRGSLQLYLDFVNLFLFLLRIMGNGRRN